MAKSPKMSYVRAGSKFTEVSYADMSEYLRVLAQNRNYLLSFPGVDNVDVGYRWEGGDLTDEVAIRVHVRTKRSQLAPEDCVPCRLAGFVVDVVVSDVCAHDAQVPVPRKQVRPLRAGLEIANAHSPSVGTLGAIVYDRHDRSPMVLSNYHVLMGDRPDAIGERVNQPGSHLGRHEIGRVVGGARHLDCAIAKLNPGIPHTTDVAEFPGGIKGIARPAIGMRVEKVGAVTGHTRGMVESVTLDSFTVVPEPRQKWTEISSAGDSGSIWIESSSHAAVGVHFAGENKPGLREERAWSIRADAVSDALEIDFCRTWSSPEYPRFAPSLVSTKDGILAAWVAGEIIEVPVSAVEEERLHELYDTERRRSRGRDYDTERVRSRGRDYDTERIRSRGRDYDTERVRSRGRDYDTERIRSRGRDYDTERVRSRGRDYDTERVRSRGRDYDTERVRSRGRDYDTERVRSRGRDYDTERVRSRGRDYETERGRSRRHLYDTEGQPVSGMTHMDCTSLVDLPERGQDGVAVMEHRWVNVQIIDRDHKGGEITTLNVGSVGEVALSVFKKEYVLVWTGLSGEIRMRRSKGGLAWAASETIPQTMSDHPPAITVFKGSLYLAWQGDDGQVWISSSKNLNTWSDPIRIKVEVSGGPILAASDDRLFLGWQAKRTKRVWFRSSADGLRFNKAYASDLKADDKPGVCSFRGRLHMTCATPESARICSQSSKTGASWDAEVSLREWASTSPGLCCDGGRLVMAWADEWSGRLTLMEYDLD